LGVALGGIAYGLANVLVALVNGAGPLRSLATVLPASLVGVGLAVGLYGQPRAGWRLGRGGWGARLAAVFGVCALAQAPVLCETVVDRYGEWLASSIFFQAEWFAYSLSYISPLQALFNQCLPHETGGCCFACVAAGSGPGAWCVACLEQGMSILDAGLVGVALVVGITAGLHLPAATVRRWLRRLQMYGGIGERP
jgi:hypothetical protein